MILIISDNYNDNINHAIAKCGVSAIEKQNSIDPLANSDILQAGRCSGKLSLRNAAAKRPEVPKSAQKFCNLSDRILLHGEIAVGIVAVGEISDWGS